MNTYAWCAFELEYQRYCEQKEQVSRTFRDAMVEIQNPPIADCLILHTLGVQTDYYQSLIAQGKPLPCAAYPV